MTSAAKPDLVQAAGELVRLSILRADPDLRSSLRDLTENGVADRTASRRLLERGRVEVGGAVEFVLALGERTRSSAHRGARAFVRGEQLQSGAKRVHLPLVDRHLERGLGGQLGKPP